MFILILSCTGQCEIQNMRVYDGPTYVSLSWDCDQPNNEFDFTYQLINLGMCDTANDTGFPVINLPSSTSNPNSNYRQFYKGSFRDINFMYANSTYLFTVQAKQWQSASGLVYGPQQGVNVTTSEGK